MLTLSQLGEYIGARHTFDLFRLETLSHYEAASDEDDFRRYQDGETAPRARVKEPFLARLLADNAAGKRWRRVHTVSHPLTDYLRYECEWGYAFNVAAGEDVRILDLDKLGLDTFEHRVADFFVIDGEFVVRSIYDDRHRFSHAEVIDDRRPYLLLSELLWCLAESFTPWWTAHTEYHRGTPAA